VAELADIVEEWLKTFAYTVATHDIEAHLDHVSRRLQVVGLTKNGFLDYRDWTNRRRNDMREMRLLRLSYKNLKIAGLEQKRLRFYVEETIKSTNGESYEIDKDAFLEQEPDGKWRLVEEQVHTVRLLPPPRMPNQQPSTHH